MTRWGIHGDHRKVGKLTYKKKIMTKKNLCKAEALAVGDLL
jgi:hypothetical protein